MGNGLVDAILLLVLLTNLSQLGSSRLRTCVGMLAVQGMALAVLPFLTAHNALGFHTIFPALIALCIRGLGFPALLFRLLREAGARREVDPQVGFTTSLLMGGAAMALCLHLSSRLVLPTDEVSPLAVPVSLFAILAGLFLIVARRTAVSQVIGYMTIENGIYAFGVAVAIEHPWLIELGVMLDVLAAVFIMGIATFHISRDFDHIDIDRLTELQERRHVRPAEPEGGA